MAETIVLDPAAVAVSRTAVDMTPWIAVEGIDWGDAAIEAYQAQAARGSTPIDFRIPNRTITIPLKLAARGATSFETIRRNLQAKTALIQREGGWLSRQTGAGTLYADVVNATLRLGGDWLQAFRDIDINAVLTLECIPDFYGAEVTLDDITQTTATEIVSKLKLSTADAVIAGDYPGRVRFVVDEDQGEAQLGLIWGIRSRHYSSASTAALSYEAEALTRLDTTAIATVTGASGGGSNNVAQHSSLATTWTPVLSTQIVSGSAHMTHTGTYRVWARAYSTSSVPNFVSEATVRLRLIWDVGDLAFPVENAPVRIPGVSNFHLVDLGEIRITPQPTGTHRWGGHIQAVGDSGGENVSLDKLYFVPVDEGYGTLRAPLVANAGFESYRARDEFNQTAGTLTGKILHTGGTWAGAGDADDFSLDTANNQATRGAVSDASGVQSGRWAIAGTATFTTIAVQAEQSYTEASLKPAWGVFARYQDLSNWVALIVSPGSTNSTLQIAKRVAGVFTQLTGLIDSGDRLHPAGQTTALRLQVDTSGRAAAWLWTPGANPGEAILVTRDAALATGGALATGRIGFFDHQASAFASTRAYDNFAALVPTLDAVLHASQSAELRWDGMAREEATGSAFGPVSQPGGSLPRIAPSGVESRPVEVFFKASRGDLGAVPDAGIDDISVRPFYRPSWLTAPGS